MEEGYYPWFINAGQADLLIEALQNFAMAYIHFSSGRVQVDFEGGETLIREYSPERKEWLNAAIPMPPVPLISVEQSFKDELLLQRLKNKAKNNNLLEMDILYLPVPVKDKSDERPYFPRVLVLLDQKNGIILDHKMLNVKMKNEEAATDMLIGYIKQHGRPGKLFVRDQYFLCYIESLCSPLNIPIAYGVPAIDRFAEETINMMDKL